MSYLANLRKGKLQTMALFLILAIFLSACGLLNAREREADNEALTQGADFGEIVLAEGIGAGNAPLQVNDTFNDSQDVIYLVAEANRLDAGTTMFARWSYEGEPFEDSSAVTADRDYTDTYVEFHLENLTSSMDKGEYSVQLFVNGNPVETLDFTIQ